MMTFVRKVSLAGIVGAAVVMAGCGSASNNDQGVSFLNMGWYSVDPEDNTCQPDTPVTGYILPLADPSSDSVAAAYGICLGVQNNMTAQFVRTQRVRLEYFVSGSVENPPTTVVAFTVVVGPQQVEGATGNSTLPPTGELPQFVVGGLTPVPAEIREWMILNRDLLPEPPFTMTVSATVIGLTSSGDQLESNPADLYVEVTPDEIIGGGSSGGDAAA